MKMRGGTTRKAEQGEALLEMALSILTIFTILFWIMEISFLMYTYAVMSDAANEGVRYAIVHPGSATGFTTNVSNRVKTFASTSMHNTSAMTVAVSDPDSTAGVPDYTPPHRVRVTVSYAYIPWLRYYMPNPPSMSAYSEGTMVVQ
jgi:Flp pilus assembly protein TadG